MPELEYLQRRIRSLGKAAEPGLYRARSVEEEEYSIGYLDALAAVNTMIEEVLWNQRRG